MGVTYINQLIWARRGGVGNELIVGHLAPSTYSGAPTFSDVVIVGYLVHYESRVRKQEMG